MIRKLLALLLTLFVLAAIALGLFAWKQHAALEQPLAVTDEALLLEVRPGDTPSGVFQRLEADGVLDDAFWLRLYWRLNLSGQSLHSGEYRLAPGMTARDMIGLWQRGEVVQYSLTLVEGWNFRQLRSALQNQPKLEQTLDGMSDGDIMAKLGAPELHPEGRFFPDTYRFTRGTSDLDLLRRAFTRLEQVLEEEWQQRAQGLPYKDAYQALIMASIIEKETGVPEERGEISGVFVRRLARGMLLQTDPTVIYGLGEAFDGNLRRRDLQADTPWNTYTRAGLPPTPIAMPGRAALLAAVRPDATRALYFVASGDGRSVFSETPTYSIPEFAAHSQK